MGDAGEELTRGPTSVRARPAWLILLGVWVAAWLGVFVGPSTLRSLHEATVAFVNSAGTACPSARACSFVTLLGAFMRAGGVWPEPRTGSGFAPSTPAGPLARLHGRTWMVPFMARSSCSAQMYVYIPGPLNFTPKAAPNGTPAPRKPEFTD